MTAPSTIRAVLGVLNRCEGHPVNREILHTQVNIDLEEPLSSAELGDAIQFAQDKGWLDFQVDAFRVRRYYITGEGRVAYREAFQ